MNHIITTLLVSAASISTSWQWNLTVQATCAYVNPACTLDSNALPNHEREKKRYLIARFQSAVLTTIVAAVLIRMLAPNKILPALSPTVGR